ncbi:MAG TPA: NAD-dependent succinate-semialdehyde dehydrogenase [Catalimonadaceae bacterium]|nr:NAD-dependent succinate-semialdehyde dehydrogenase [Catalimonadaceae bacterium]
MNFKSINPYNLEKLAEFRPLTELEITSRLAQSRIAFSDWKNSGLEDRLQLLGKLADVIDKKADWLAFQMSEEMGKTLSESKAEVMKCAMGARFFQKNASDYLAPKTILSDSRISKVLFQPIGGVLLVMPWNFPLWQVLRAAIPALCVGNTIILKHAPNVMRYAHQIEALFAEAGFPNGVFTNLVVDVNELERVVSNEAVAAVSLTGSEFAGRSMARIAGKYLKKCVLELGGSDPFIVLPDADLKNAGNLAAQARLINNGQSCIAAKRFIVHETVADDFLDQFVAELEKFQPGDPTLPETKLGPMARKDLADALERQKQQSIQMGGTLFYEMNAQPTNGFFSLPAIITGARPGMVCFDEETFGPLSSVSTFSSIQEAIDLANHTRFGLGATIHTQDEEQAQKLAEKLDCGTVAINAMVRSKPMLPFGGIKSSGYGKELSEFGMYEFANAKAIVVG